MSRSIDSRYQVAASRKPARESLEWSSGASFSVHGLKDDTVAALCMPGAIERAMKRYERTA
jgi:hypothetical protein